MDAISVDYVTKSNSGELQKDDMQVSVGTCW